MPAAVGGDVATELKSVQVGEDAYFLRSDSLGVADGVGGWSGQAGADPALFSRLLMHRTYRLAILVCILK